MALDTTVGGASSDSYATIEDADTYFAGHPKGAEWEALEEAKKERLLRMAAQWMQQKNWQGCRTSMDQALAWPRSGVHRFSVDLPEMDVAGLYPQEAELSDAAIPEEIKAIQCEAALWLLNQTGDLAGVRAVSVPGLSLTMGGVGGGGVGSYLMGLISPWLKSRSSAVIRIRRA